MNDPLVILMVIGLGAILFGIVVRDGWRAYRRRKRHHVLHITLSQAAEQTLAGIAAATGVTLSTLCSHLLEQAAKTQLQQATRQLLGGRREEGRGNQQPPPDTFKAVFPNDKER